MKSFTKKRVSGLDLKSSEDKIVESFENYLRIKFLDFKNENQVEKKLKSYKKDLNDQFKSKITELKDITLDQAKFNSLISKLITNMSLDENFEEEQKRDDQNEEENKNPETQNQEKENQKKKRKNI